MEGIMKTKNRFRGMMFFLAGLLTASVLQFSFPGQQDVMADQYSCIRQDLDAYGMSGNIPDPRFTITYNVHTCYGGCGYTVERVYMYGNQVAVKYKNTSAASSILRGSQGQGGFRTIP
jgi:hypothetical protein